MLFNEFFQRVLTILLTITATSFVISNIAMTYISWRIYHNNSEKKHTHMQHILVVPGMFAGKILAKLTKQKGQPTPVKAIRPRTLKKHVLIE